MILANKKRTLKNMSQPLVRAYVNRCLYSQKIETNQKYIENS